MTRLSLTKSCRMRPCSLGLTKEVFCRINLVAPVRDCPPFFTFGRHMIQRFSICGGPPALRTHPAQDQMELSPDLAPEPGRRLCVPKTPNAQLLTGVGYPLSGATSQSAARHPDVLASPCGHRRAVFPSFSAPQSLEWRRQVQYQRESGQHEAGGGCVAGEGTVAERLLGN